MRELRKFAMDNVAHHPNMKLEYIALESTVEALVRKTVEKKADKQQRAGKGKKAGENHSSSTDETGSSDDDSDDTESSPSLKVETIENLEFYDPDGIRIFRKEVRAGRL